MSHLIVTNLKKTVGAKTLFENVDFTIYEGERAGLIGINGTGKSTLLGIIAGIQEADEATIECPNKYRIAYLEQDPKFTPGETVLQAVFNGDAPILQLNRQYEDALAEMILDPESEVLQNELFRLQQQMDDYNAWDVNSLAKQALTKLGIDFFDREVTELSGGQQKRVALAKVLIEPADLYLLDEPTNHLDVESTEWLQDMVSRLTGAVIFITHDRYFLDEISTHIYELADQTLYRHTGNYGEFLEARAIREENNASTQAKLRNRYRSELKWIRRGAKARTTKQKARIQRFDQLDDAVDRNTKDESLELSLATTRLGRKVLESEGISKTFGDRKIVEDFKFLLQQGDRIGIIGANGYGKSTVMNMLAGELAPDKGEVIVGATVKLLHFKQALPLMNENERMIEYIREASNDIADSDGVRYSATQMLERFLFPLNSHGTPISKLSGGERKRLHLLRLLMEQPNVLLLDEPTNDLDIETLGVLEDFIEHFPGVVITISHDRFFLDRIARKLWVLDGKGNVDEYLEVYTDYLVIKATQDAEEAKEQKLEKVRQDKAKQEKKKLTFKEQKEWDTIAEEIATTEAKIEQAEASIANTGADFTLLQKLTDELDALNSHYEHLLERWSYLEELVNG